MSAKVCKSVIPKHFSLFNIFSEPYTRYTIWIRAFTDKHEGVPSQEMTIWTDVQSPGQPEIVSLTCQSGSTMFVRWMRPEIFFRTVDVYTVHYRARSSIGLEHEWEQQLVETVNNTINHMMYINNLTTNTGYEKPFLIPNEIFLKPK